MKKRHALIVLFTPFILFGIVAGGVYLWWIDANKPINPNLEAETVLVIPKGAGVIEIGNLLKDKNLIKHQLAFRLLVMQKGIDQKIQAGSFRLKPSQSLEEIALELTEGKEDFWVTIPEGKRNEEVAWLLKKEFQKNGISFDIAEFLTVAKNIDGYLYPDTYLLPKTMDEKGVAELMRSTFDQKIPDQTRALSAKHSLTFSQALIIASLVEREAKFDSDRPKVAAVIINRLKIGMPLQIDATVQYAKANAVNKGSMAEGVEWWPAVSQDDLKYYDSSYNTYTNSGLPPAPICNPGLEAIKAVLSPDEHNYLYYISEPNGTTHYSETYEEHQENIAKYL